MVSLAQIQEIADRGIQDQLPPERKAKFDEMVSRGMVTLSQETSINPVAALEQLQPSVDTSVDTSVESVEEPGMLSSLMEKIGSIGQPPQIAKPGIGDTIPGTEQQQPSPIPQPGIFDGFPEVNLPSFGGQEPALEMPDLSKPLDIGAEQFNKIVNQEALQKSMDVLHGAGGKLKSELEILQSTNHKGVGTLGAKQKIQSLKDRFSLGLTDSPAERTQGYIDKYGEDGFIDNKVAGVILTPKGLLKGGYADTEEQAAQMGLVTLGEMTLSAGDVADVSGLMPEIVAGTATAIATEGLSLIPALMMVATTTGLTRFAQEEIEAMLGDSGGGVFGKEQNTRAERVEMGKTAAKWAAGGEIAARTFIAAGRKVFQGLNLERKSAFREAGGWPKFADFKNDPQKFFGQLKKVAKAVAFGKRAKELTTKVDPIKLQVQKEADTLGVTLPLEQATGGRNPIVERVEATAETVFGDIRKTRQQRNAAALEAEAKKLVEKAGETPKGVDRLIPKEGDNVGLIDRVVQDKITRTTTQHVARIDELERSIDKNIGQQINRLKRTKPTGDVGEGVQSGISKVYDDAHTKSSELYGEIDSLLPKNAKGQTPKVVPTAPIRKAISDYLETNFAVKTTERIAKNGKVVVEREFIGMTTEAKKIFNDMMSADKMQGFQAIHASRSRLRKLAYDKEFLKNVDDRFFRIMEKAHDDALSRAVLGNSKKAKQALVVADDFYKSQIPKFDNLFIKGLLRDSRKGGIQSSQVVGKIENAAKEDVELLFRPKEKGQKPLLGHKEQREVRESIVAGWLEKAGAGSKEISEIKVSHIIEQVRKMQKKGTFGTIFGEHAKDLSRLIAKLEARNAKVSVKGMKIEKLGIGEFRRLLKDAAEETAKRDLFQSNNFVKELQKNGGDAQDTLLYLLQPNRRKNIKEAKSVIGEKTAEWAAIKEGAMKQILDSIINHTEDVGRIFLKGEGLLGKLLGGPNQQSMKAEFTELFGKEMYEEMLKFARVATAAGRESSKSSGIIAAVLGLHPFKNMTRLIGLKTLATTMNSPAGIRFMTNGIKRSLAARHAAAGITRAGTQTTAQVANEEIGSAVSATKRAGKSVWGLTKSVGKAAGNLIVAPFTD